MYNTGFVRTRLLILASIILVFGVVALLPKTTNYPTDIDYSRSPSQHVLTAGFQRIEVCTEDTTDDCIIGIHDTADMYLFTFDEPITVSDARWAMHNAGYEPARIIELISFVTQHPDVCHHKRVVALSEWNHHDCAYPIVACESRRIWTMRPPEKIWLNQNVYTEVPDTIDLTAYYLGYAFRN